jgi:hypothetical protein
LTTEGVLRAVHGRELDVTPGWTMSAAGEATDSRFVRLLDQSGQLVGIAEPAGAPGILHPFVVLV